MVGRGWLEGFDGWTEVSLWLLLLLVSAHSLLGTWCHICRAELVKGLHRLLGLLGIHLEWLLNLEWVRELLSAVSKLTTKLRLPGEG